ncbi:MAG: hypothetical protein OXF02_05810 [Simkaniaceae bacterium]|nr:hypothetical protein [Simkaniaceae bacterium]
MESLPSDRSGEYRDDLCRFDGMKADKQRLLDRAGVRQDIAIVRRRFTPSPGESVGNNVWSDDAVIYLDDDLCKVDRDCAGWIVNHEIKHILSCDAVRHGVVAGVNDLVRPVALVAGCLKAMRTFFRGGVAGRVVAPLLGMTAVCFVGNRAVGALSLWQEAKADDFAITHATEEELKGARRFFTVLGKIDRDASRILRDRLAENLSYPLGMWRNRIKTSSSGGWYLFNPRHPSNKSRLHKVEKALAVRGIKIDEQVEEQRVERLRIPVVRCLILQEQRQFSGSYPALMYHTYDSMISSDATDTPEESRV